MKRLIGIIRPILIEYIATLLGIVLWIWFLHWISVRHTGKSILLWYVEKGFEINVVFTIISAVWGDLNKRVGMISANLYEYIGSYLKFMGSYFVTIGPLGFFRGQTTKASQQLVPYGKIIKTINAVFGLSLSVFSSVLLLGWLICIVPIQYFVFLLCGAPARLYLETPVKYMESNILGKAFGRSPIICVPVEKKVPEGWQEYTFHDKPMTITLAITSVVFWVINL